MSLVHTTPSSVQTINEFLKVYGLQASVTLVTPSDNVNFNRSSASADTAALSYGRVCSLHNTRGIALPRHFRATDDEPVIHVATKPGFMDDDRNPNPDGLGLVSWRRWLALGVPFADAPAAVVIHPSTGVKAAVSGAYPYLPRDPVGQTIEAIRDMVQNEFAQIFTVADLRVILAPGARANGFYIDEKAKKRLLVGGKHYEDFIFDAADYPVEIPVAGQDRPYALDLSGLFRSLWLRAGILPAHVHWDERNTVTDLTLPSKRQTDAQKKPYASGLIAVAVKQV